MKIAISGTYSSGKTTTTLALANYSGIPRTHAKTMREILPEALPGKKLEDCSIADLFQLGMIRYSERFAHESRLPTGFISDGSALHEWVYGSVRTTMGLRPGASDDSGRMGGEQLELYRQVMDAIGSVVKRHARKSYDVFVHLPIEFPLSADGHRPVSEEFRAACDSLLIRTVEDLAIPIHVIGGTVDQRIMSIAEQLEITPVMKAERAIKLAEAEMAKINTASEEDRWVKELEGVGE